MMTFFKLYEEILHWLTPLTDIEKTEKIKGSKFSLALNLLHRFRASTNVLGVRYYTGCYLKSM